jgi:hypothetical protein
VVPQFHASKDSRQHINKLSKPGRGASRLCQDSCWRDRYVAILLCMMMLQRRSERFGTARCRRLALIAVGFRVQRAHCKARLGRARRLRRHLALQDDASTAVKRIKPARCRRLALIAVGLRIQRAHCKARLGRARRLRRHLALQGDASTAVRAFQNRPMLKASTDRRGLAYSTCALQGTSRPSETATYLVLAAKSIFTGDHVKMGAGKAESSTCACSHFRLNCSEFVARLFARSTE